MWRKTDRKGRLFANTWPTFALIKGSWQEAAVLRPDQEVHIKVKLHTGFFKAKSQTDLSPIVPPTQGKPALTLGILVSLLGF